MSNRLFSGVCPITRAAPSRRRRQEREGIVLALVIAVVIGAMVASHWRAMLAAEPISNLKSQISNPEGRAAR